MVLASFVALSTFFVAAEAYSTSRVANTGSINVSHIDAREKMRAARRAMYHEGRYLDFLDRKLQDMTWDEFCTDTADVETFITNELKTLVYTEGVTWLSESGNYRCTCDSAGTFVCRIMYRFDADPPETEPVSNIEQVAWTNGQARIVQWCEVFEGNRDGAQFCERFDTQFPTNPELLQSCIVTDTTGFCDTPYECTICEGSTTVAVSNPSTDPNCQFTAWTCDDNYNGAFLYGYFLADPFSLDTSDRGTGECVSDAPSVEEYCSDLSEITDFITTRFTTDFPDNPISDPVVCACKDAPAVGVSCSLKFTDVNGEFSIVDELDFIVVQQDYYLPNTAGYCITDPAGGEFCESMSFAVGREELHSCFSDGVQAAFCELCDTGYTIGTSQLGGISCLDGGWVSSYMIEFNDDRIAVDKCTSSPTMMPSVAATESPTATPTSMPTEMGSAEPTQEGGVPATDAPTMEDGSSGDSGSSQTHFSLGLLGGMVAGVFAVCLF